MKIKTLFFTTILGCALLFSGLTGVGFSRENTVKDARAEGEPNSTYVKIYDDSWNNTAISSGYNQVLIVYSGTAHGLTSDGVYDSSVLSKVSINGTLLTQLPGSVIIPWEGQFWFRIAYPNTVSTGDILEVQSGLTVGSCIMDGFKLKLNENSKWDYYFGEAVNATFSSIYNDDYNNIEHYTGFNRLLIVYNGPAHGNPSAVSSPDELKKYDQYVLIDGVPLSTGASGSGTTQISAWSGQTWVMIIYPASAVSEGSILEVREGTKVGNAVLEKMVFKLNSSSKWEKQNYIADDSLVKNSDYKLFTISDYPFASNSSYIFFAGSEFVDAMNDSFGFRFIVNIPTGKAASTSANLNMACTNIYGSNPIIKVTLNYGSNSYLTFNGNIDWSTNLSPVWTEDEDHLVEVYFIRTSSTTGNVLLGIDGNLIWKSASQNFEGLTWHNYFTTTGGDTASYYSSATDTTAKALARFNSRKLHSEDVSFSDNRETNNCKTYYGQAKAFYNDFLTGNQRKEFASSASYANHRARFIAWGAANGESVSFNGSTGDLIVASNANMLSAIVEDKSALIIVVISSFVTVTALLYILVLKKRKQQ